MSNTKSKTSTIYIVAAKDTTRTQDIGVLLDSDYTLVKSWVAGETVHHLLSKNLEDSN